MPAPSTPDLVARLATGVVHGVDAADDGVGAEHFGPAQGQRQHDGVARRHVGDRDAGTAGLGHVDVVGQRRAADAAQVHVHGLVRDHALGLGHARGGIQFGGMARAIAHAQGMHGEALFLGHGDDGG
ncbi:hypothetical protein G6F45_013962 [Rhizopus arrhizus]|nr:hypothetical protein G6F45_013962 [Rhizopus arrhizus]